MRLRNNCVGIILFLIVSSLWMRLDSAPDRNASSPSIAANCVANNTYPVPNQQLYANSEYNFTANVRDDAAWGRVWNSANLMTTSDGSGYDNVSLNPGAVAGLSLGQYNATDTFDDTRAGGLDDDWSYSLGAGCSASVVETVLGHQTVLTMLDAGAGTYNVAQTFAAQASGNISFWWCSPSAPSTANTLEFRAYDGAANLGPRILWSYSSSGQVQSTPGGVATGLSTYVASRWYYIEIGFDTDVDRAIYTIDGVVVGNWISFHSVTGALTNIQFLSEAAGTAGDTCVDAVDYNWTAGWTSTRRAAVDLGSNGHGNGIGLYNATYSFENETMFTNSPGGFTDVSGASCYTRVFPAVATGAYGHHSVLCLDDQSGTYSSAFNLTLPNTAMTSGSVEFWFFDTAVANAINIAVLYKYNTGLYAVNLYTGSSNLYADVGGGTLICALSSNAWYHLRIAFDCGASVFSVWVNGMLRASNLAFSGACSSVGTMRAIGNGAGTGFQFYYDAIDVSTDPAYYTERSSWMFLNQSQSFSVPGDYSYRFSVWSAGVEYFPTSWTPFSVRENVQLISDSPISTSWMFISPETTWGNIYAANFGNDAWTPNVVKNLTYYTSAIADARLSVANPNTAYGTDNSIVVANDSLDGIRWQSVLMFPNSSFAYLMENANISYLSLYQEYQVRPPPITHVYNTTWFDETTVTYNTRPTTGNFFCTETVPGGTGWVNFNFNAVWNNNFNFLLYCEPQAVLSGRSREGGYAPQLHYNVPNFYNRSGLISAQTNTTETVSLRSPVFANNLTLYPNDRITVIFNTTCANNIAFNLKSGNTVVKAFTLSESPNYLYSTQTKQFSILREVAFDQLEFSGLFSDTNNLQITNITIDRPLGYTVQELAGFSREMVSLPLSNYSLLIFQGDDLVLSQDVLIHPFMLNKLSYSPISGGQRIVNFFDQTGKLIDFYQFQCNLTRVYNNISTNFLLTTPYFYADDMSTYQLNVTDHFGNSIVNRTDIVSTFIDITLTNVYSLKVKNEMRLPTLLQLTRNGITQSEYAMNGEIVQYTLFGGMYDLNYTQSELNTPVSVTLNVNAPSIYNISSAYHTIYFSAFSNDGLGVPTDSVRLYCNNSRKAWGPVELLGITNVTVLDYLNDTQYSAVLDLSGVSEMCVFIQIATLIVNNLMRNESISLEIYKSGLLLQNQTIGPAGGLAFRFTNGHYDVNCTYVNGTVETQGVDVIANSSDLKTFTLYFGHYDDPLPQEIPKPGFTEVIILISIIAVIAIIAIAIYASYQRSRRLDAERFQFEVNKRGR